MLFYEKKCQNKKPRSFFNRETPKASITLYPNRFYRFQPKNSQSFVCFFF